MIMLVEGPEDALTLHHWHLHMPIWCAFGSMRIVNAAIPQSARRLILSPDPNEAGYRLFEQARTTLARNGLHITEPLASHDDCNAIHMAAFKQGAGPIPKVQRFSQA